MRVELEAGLDDPDRIGSSTCRDACDGGSGEVNPRVFMAMIKVVGDNLLAVPVGEEVDGPRRDDADESGGVSGESGESVPLSAPVQGSYILSEAGGTRE